MDRALWAAGIGLALAAAAAAGAGAAELATTHIRVVDERGAQLAGAEVLALVHGALVPLGRTGRDGDLTIALAGDQTLIVRSGRRSSAPAKLRGSTLQVAFPVATIGTVRARNPHPDEKTIDEASESAIAFDDVALARSLVPNYRSRAEGGTGHQTLNGVPLDLPAGPRGAGDDPGVPSDLIDSFSATQADDGTITPNYHLLAPTAALAARFATGRSAYDGSLWKAGLSGTSHGLGFAIAAATGGDDGPLAGLTRADASGLVYGHSQNARHTDVSLSLSHAIGSTQINAAGFASRKTGDDITATMPGDVLAGIGPGNVTTKDSAFEYVIATQTHGRDSYHALDSRFAGGSADDAPNAMVAGIAAGYVSGYRYSGGYDELAFTRSFATSSLTLKTTLTQTSTSGYITTASFAAQTPARAGQSTTGLDYEHNAGSSGYGLEVDGVDRFGSFYGSTFEGRAHVKTVVAGTPVQLSFVHGQSQTQEAYSAGGYDFSAPTAASITCLTPSATVTGSAGALGRHPEADTLDLRLHRELPRGISVSAGGFVSYGRNSLVFPAAALGSSLDPAYRSAIAANYSLLCPGQALSPADIYVQRYETVPRLIGREWFVDAGFPLGPLHADATYETYSLEAPQTAADLIGVASTLVPGAQLPGVPLHRANLLVSYRHGRFVLASALQYTSANNADALPGHVTVTVGTQIPLGPGTLALSAQNLLHAYSGTFVSPRYAVPLDATSGVFPTLAIPLRPVWSLRYTLPIGSLFALHHQGA